MKIFCNFYDICRHLGQPFAKYLQNTLNTIKTVRIVLNIHAYFSIQITGCLASEVFSREVVLETLALIPVSSGAAQSILRHINKTRSFEHTVPADFIASFNGIA